MPPVRVIDGGLLHLVAAAAAVNFVSRRRLLLMWKDGAPHGTSAQHLFETRAA